MRSFFDPTLIERHGAAFIRDDEIDRALARLIPKVRITKGRYTWPARADVADSLTWMLPESVSSYGPSVDKLYYYLILTTGIAFSIVVTAVLYMCVRYRHKEGRKAYYTQLALKSARSRRLARRFTDEAEAAEAELAGGAA